MENEGVIQLGVFLGLFTLLALIEVYAPRRIRRQSQRRWWMTNCGITILNTVTLRAMALVLPLLAVGAAVDAQAQGWGLFNSLDWPSWIEVTLAVLILDCAIWAQHLVTHKIPLLWRLHRLHHADVEMDVTTAIRFNPVEIALSMLLKIGLIYALGPAAIAVIIFKTLLNGTAMFNRANIRLPRMLMRLYAACLLHPTCTVFITPRTAASMTAIMGLPFRSGARCSAPTSRSLQAAMARWKSGCSGTTNAPATSCGPCPFPFAESRP